MWYVDTFSSCFLSPHCILMSADQHTWSEGHLRGMSSDENSLVTMCNMGHYGEQAQLFQARGTASGNS